MTDPVTQGFDIFSKILTQHGLSVALLILVLIGIFLILWKLANRVANSTITNMDNISKSNEKFAESSIKMCELVSVIAEQTESTASELNLIKKNIQKQNRVIAECVESLKSILEPSDKNNIILNNILKEIQRPVDE